jgi:hypothetical protein
MQKTHFYVEKSIKKKQNFAPFERVKKSDDYGLKQKILHQNLLFKDLDFQLRF